MEGGAGGETLIDAGGDVTINGRTELDGASPDGDGGTVDVSAVGAINQNGLVTAISKTFGQSDELSFDGRRLILRGVKR